MGFFLTTIVQWRWRYDDHNDDDDDDDDDDDYDDDDGGGVRGDAMLSPGIILGTDEVGVGVMTTTKTKVAIILGLMWRAVIYKNIA